MKTGIGVACVAVLLGTQAFGTPVRAQGEKFRQLIVVDGIRHGGSGDYLLTFNAPVALPGMSLAPGSYLFRRPAHMTIQVASATGEPYSMFSMVTTRRGTYKDLKYIEAERVLLTYSMPLAELIIDFYDQLKTRTQGYASLDYSFGGYHESDLVKLDILVNAVAVDALSLIVHREKAYHQGRALVEKLRSLIPRQLFEVPIQAAIGSRVISRETVKAMRKDVLAKCYGGDISRKRKLLEKQKEGKKRMKMVGNVEIPQEAFMAVLSLGE